MLKLASFLSSSALSVSASSVAKSRGRKCPVEDRENAREPQALVFVMIDQGLDNGAEGKSPCAFLRCSLASNGLYPPH